MRSLTGIPLICLLLSQGTIIISYLISIQFDRPKVETCNPFLQGCLNITDAGIYGLEGFVFRGGMIAACAFFIVWWLMNHDFSLGLPKWFNRLKTAMGILGSILLIGSTAVLIPPRSAIPWDEHIFFATFFFLITFVAQALDLAGHYLFRAEKQVLTVPLKIKWICVLMQGIMIASVFVLRELDTGDWIGNAIEWWLALLIGIYYASNHGEWKRKLRISQ
ncbi:hypothetical protein HF888_05335 [Bermanella marisrubri]|uniref:CWH43-like N-terminal domain-containing protein n=1 Tax=Bermanella marisrubri TaxID=207949 RepID=Q1N1S1_9GAMM|nr:hypothetical protein [Bermanella marisrubri]EAT12210.1 hypothetical protein RED65_04270 [Oceanobacter sp. RED65] [Bermanella marisrubri]QIZ83680.1 hypothetical protein HF888_05335 [Bermanella marisrubri]